MLGKQNPLFVAVRSRRVSTQATAGSEDVDFDKVLSDLADKVSVQIWKADECEQWKVLKLNLKFEFKS